MSTIKRLIFALFTIFFVSWAVPAMAAIEPVFTVTTTNMPAGTVFSFAINAPGTYYIDWGDDSSVQTITSTGTITHTFANGGVNTIGFAGGATLPTIYPAKTITFTDNKNVASLGGSLGALFPTVGENAPAFQDAFKGCSNLTAIPSTLFSGVTKSADKQFNWTFSGCTSLKSIPDGLFADLDDDAATSQFNSTFNGCAGLTGSIPGTLFSGVKSTAENLFDSTFEGCKGLTGQIPATLFATIQGDAKDYMFNGTFDNCSGLTGSIPGDLFSSITGLINFNTFNHTFMNCTGLTGEIPADLFSSFSGKPQYGSLNQTFAGCTGLTGTVPTTLFSTLDNADYASGPMSGIFTDTGLATSCPVGEYQYMTGFEVDFDGKVACAPCPANHYCTLGATEPTACPQGYISNEKSTAETDCHKTCNEITIINGTATPVQDTVVYPVDCEYASGVSLMGNACQVISTKNGLMCSEPECPYNQEMSSPGICTQCDVEHAIDYLDNGSNCMVKTCDDGYEPYMNSCRKQKIECDAPFATKAYQYWDEKYLAYGPCIIEECEPGRHIDANACELDNSPCNIENGTGEREWDGDKWGTCFVTACETGFTENADGTQCERCENYINPETGEPAVSSYISGCEIAACMYQGEVYVLENNECNLICTYLDDETGHRELNNGRCVRTCNDGYMPW